MSHYDSDYSDKTPAKRPKNPKFRDYYDETFDDEDEKDLYKRKKKLGKKPRRKKDPDDDWSDK